MIFTQTPKIVGFGLKSSWSTEMQVRSLKCKLVGRILVACLVVMAPVFVGLLDLVVFFKHLLVNELACQSVPKAHNFEPSHSS